MNEQDWLVSADPAAMLAHVRGKVSDRSLRLFACAVCRQAWAGVPCGRCKGEGVLSVYFVVSGKSSTAPMSCPDCRGTGKAGGLTDPRSRLAVETVERHADGLATDGELAAACRLAGGVAGPSDDASWWAYVWAAGGHVEQASGRIECVPAAVQAALLRDVVGNPFRPTPRCQSCLGGGYVPTDRDDNTCDVCGGKGRHVPRRWLTPTVRVLARACYDERDGEACGRCEGGGTVCDAGGAGYVGTMSSLAAQTHVRYSDDRACPDCAGTGRVVTAGHLDPVRLALLADALEEAGCTDAALLGHLRGILPDNDPTPWEHRERADGSVAALEREMAARLSPAVHVRGCWAIDLILGKE